MQTGRSILFLPVFLAAGSLAYFTLTFEPSLAWAALACLVSVALTALVWQRERARAAALCVAFTAAGFALACLAAHDAPAWIALPRHAVVVTGRVSVLDVLPEGRRVTLEQPSLDGGPPLARSVRIRLRTKDAGPAAPGDTLRVRALLKPPNPPDYPGGWDTQRDAWFAGLGGYGFAIGPSERLTAAGGSPWAGLRARIAQRVMAGLPGAEGAIAATLLTGLGSAIPAQDRAAFQDSGLAHLLAVAGLHIGIVMGLVFGATRFGLALWERAALYWPTRQIAALGALAAGAGYLALTGAHVPIIRSFAMAGLVTLGVLTGRRAVSLRGLALAATILLVLAPQSVVGVSFQMSFAAVLTLIAGYEMARPALAMLGQGTRWRGPVLMVAGLVLTSLLAGTASLPFAAYHFGRATLYYLPANMAAVPLTAFWVMPCGLAALALMPVGLERLALVPMGWGIHGLLAIAHAVAGWPGAVVQMRQPPGWGLALVAVGMAWAGLWRGRRRLGGLLPIALGLAAPLLFSPPDVLLTAQGTLLAVRTGGHTLVLAQRGASPFEREAPARLFGGGAGTPLVADPACTAEACRLTVRGQPVAVALTAAPAGCGVVLVVSPLRTAHGCTGAVVLDGGRVRDGAAAAWVGAGGTRVVTDLGLRGVRPWVVRGRVLLPFAETE